MSDQAELERRAGEYLQGAVGREGTGKTKYSGRLPDGLRDHMMDGIRLGRAAMYGIDFGFAYGIGDPVDWPDNLIECTDYTELPPEQLFLTAGEEVEDE